MRASAFIAASFAALSGGLGGFRPPVYVPRAKHDPERVAAAEAKREMRRQKVLRQVANGGYRSATWLPS